MTESDNIHVQALEAARNTRFPEAWDKQSNLAFDECDIRHLLSIAVQYNYMDLVEKSLDWLDVEKVNLNLKERLALLDLTN